jgi:outer membrane lipoprotein-sorting protein
MSISIRNRMLASTFFVCVALGLTSLADQPQALELNQVVEKLEERLQQAQGLSLDVEYRPAKGNPAMARIMALRPNYYRVETEHQSFYCDGTAAWQYFPLRAVYRPFHKDDKGMHIPFAAGFTMYSPVPQYKPDYKEVEEVVFEGKSVIALVEEPKEIPNLRVRIFIDPETWLPVGSDQKSVDDVTVFVYRNVKIDRHFVPADFAWAPPNGVVDDTKIKTDSPKPLQVGEIAPDSGAYKLKNCGRPITYLIRPDRTVAYVQIGYDTENKLLKLKEELVKLGINH